MGITNDGVEFHVKNMLGESVTNFDNSNAALGVGDDDSSFSASQSELQAEAGSGDATRKGMDSGYPERDPDGDGSNRKVRYQASFDTDEANFRWEEWGLFNDPSSGSGVMHNREVEYIGEKTDKTKWVFQVDIELNPA